VAVLAQQRSARVGVVLGVASLLLTACTATASDDRPDPTSPPSPSRTIAGAACSVVVDTRDGVMGAFETARPGSTVCVVGDELADADLVMDRSGAEDEPIVLAAEGAVVRSLIVDADHVVVQGFVVDGGEGLDLRGAGLVARDNEVRRAEQDGISCEESCEDVLIEGNTVVETDGAGIIVEGERITVRGNSVSGSVRREAGDADGIRFFGSDVQILENSVFDIKDDGYEGEPPHTDCFQTYDNSRMPTVDAVIAGNECRNVDHQCLIATAEESGEEGEVGRSHGIEFTGNLCQVEGSQALLIQWFPDVAVRGNTFEGVFDRAAIFLEGSTDGEFRGNTVPGDVVPYEVDPSSRDGFRGDAAN
jgi:parallel beta-helix repeat protein